MLGKIFSEKQREERRQYQLLAMPRIDLGDFHYDQESGRTGTLPV